MLLVLEVLQLTPYFGLHYHLVVTYYLRLNFALFYLFAVMRELVGREARLDDVLSKRDFLCYLREARLHFAHGQNLL